MKYKIKKHHIFLFLLVVIILIIVAYTSYKEKVRKNSLPKILSYHLDCQSDKIDEYILNLHSDTSLIGAYVEFDQLPRDKATRKVLEKGDIELDERSQLFEISPKIYARIPKESLCDLVALETVKYISMPHDDSIKKYETE